MINQKEFDNRCIKMWKMVYLTYGMNFPLTWNNELERMWRELYDICGFRANDSFMDDTYLGVDSITKLDWVNNIGDDSLREIYQFTQKFIDEVINATT